MFRARLLPPIFLALALIVPREARGTDSVPSVRRIGVVNVGKIFDQYERTRTLDAKLEKLSESKQAEREKLVSEIKTLREELLLLNEESRAEREKEIEEKMRSLASFDRDTKDALRKQRDDSAKTILDEIEAAVASFAKEHGYELILSDRAVLYGMNAMDVSSEILALLNDRYVKEKKQ